MKTVTKTPLRSTRIPINATAEKWHAIAAAVAALKTELAPVIQPLTATERRQMLGVSIANEAFTRDYLELLEAHPDIVPPTMHPADIVRDWHALEELSAHHQALLDLAQEVEDTMSALQSGCYAAALAGYKILIRGEAPLGLDAAVAQLREHFARRLERAKQTRAAKSKPGAGAGAAAPGAEAAVIPMSPAANAPASPRNGPAPAAVAA